jgi:hypothetical protein
MNLVKLTLAVLFGVLLGAALFGTPKVKANPQESGTVHVAVVPIPIPNDKNLSSRNLLGEKIVGISCLPKPAKQLPYAAVCYVATSPN